VAIVCLDCACVVLYSDVRAHLINKHPRTAAVFKMDAFESAMNPILQHYNVMDSWEAPDLSDMIVAYDGILIAHDCWQCPSCLHGFPLIKSARNHVSTNHPEIYSERMKFERHDMQRLTASPGPARIYFPVILHDEEGVVQPSLRDFIGRVEERLDDDIEGGQSLGIKDPRLFEPWLLQLGFIDHITGYEIDSLFPLPRSPQNPNGNVSRLRYLVHGLFSEAEDLIDKTHDILLRHINTSEPKKCVP
jgi:hypothetical protein